MNKICNFISFIFFGALPGVFPAPATAQCADPHVLSNGQVADATNVMENFDAVAGCADDVGAASVKATGAPTAGEIAVFSGDKTVTGGDLSGDVVTSGDTTTSLASTGVTPGYYSNPNITVDAKGRITDASNGVLGGGSGVGAFTTLAYHPSYTLTAGTSTIVDPTLYDEVMVVARNITKSLSGAFAMRFSVDGGSTYVSSGIYIVDISTSGSVGYADGAIYQNGGSTAARSHYLDMPNLKSTVPRVFSGSRSGIFDHAGAITHIMIYSTAGNITGGSLTVLAR